MRDLVKTYFDENSIVNHHIASFDDFLASADNPNSRMQKIVDDIRVPNDDAERGIICLDKDHVGGNEIKIRIGRKRDEDGKVEPSAKRTIRVGPPEVVEANGYVHQNLTPMEARLRNLNYSSPVYVNFTIIANGVEREEADVRVGYLPMMVKSKGCNLNKEVIERAKEHEISDEEYEQELISNKEDPRDPGGYFIIGGTERVLITLEDLAPNRVMVERGDRSGTEIEVAKIFSQKDGYRALTQVEKKKDGTLWVSVPVTSSSIPLVALMKALGMESDQEIFETIAGNKEKMTNIVYANIETSYDKKNFAPNGFHTKEDAIHYLERNFAAGQAKEYRTKKVDSILDRNLLPHLGDTEADRLKKAIFLGRIARSVLELSLGERSEDDKDHYANKRLKLSGDLMEDLFRTSFSSLMKDLKYQLEKNWSRKKKENDLKISSSIRPDLLTHKLLHALATGNWVGGRAGVSQLLDRTSNMSATSHLRRITSSLTRSQPHFEARDLHPTQWGRLCPSETPEGQNCGLVKNAALIIDVSRGLPDDDAKWTLKELGLTQTSGAQGTRVFVNGDLVGSHDDAAKLVADVRDRRRCGVISGEINIHYDEEMNEVIINCDEGRLRRPLLIVKDGKTILNRARLEGLRDKKVKWNDLFREGIMEWVDAEEEEDALIAVEPFTVPKRCEHCDHALSPTDVDWMNPGKEGNAVLKCNWCGEEFEVPSKLTKEHTHMEVDPMVILGVAAGLVPYPEHNSSPRVTLGAAMAKQALGVPASNYRIRPDTRGHLLHYPQEPMVQTEIMKFMGYNYRPAGQNFCIAVLSYHGYNIEDALVMNKSSIQRGLGRSTFMRTYRAEERRYPNSQEDHFEIPEPGVLGIRDDASYASLGEDGLISPETKINGSDVLIGKTSPPRFSDEEADFLMNEKEKRRETSVTVRHGETGYVDSVMVTESENGCRLARVKVRDQRVPELGDKFCSRHGQKGVIGRLVSQEDMPFTIDGITPDLVVNPHGIPSRMTIAHVLEMIGGKVGAMEGRTIDGTVFSGEREDSIRDGLVKNGFKHTGKEIMYDGRTGKQLSVDIYTGVIFYEKLHHMVSGKMHVRSTGPVQILTRQPTEGRSRQGGLRFGEMERDCLIGHGAAMVIKDRLLDESDGTQQYVCGNPNCGHIAILNNHGNLYCPVCGEHANIHLVQTSYAFKLLMDELLSLGVAMRLQLEDLR